MDKNDNTLVVKTRDYSVEINKSDDTIVVRYGRQVLARSKRRYLVKFIECICIGIIALLIAVVALTYDISLGIVVAVFAVLFFIMSYQFRRQFVVFRDWLGELERSMSEKK